jgi:hypothetical protein
MRSGRRRIDAASRRFMAAHCTPDPPITKHE